MSEPQQENPAEPTMEEILSSIRRIISDDDEPAASSNPADKNAAPQAAQAADKDEFAEVVEEADAEDVLQLTKVVNEDGSVTDIDPQTEDEIMFDELVAELEPEIALPEPVEPATVDFDEPILGEAAARATIAALNQLVVEMPRHIGVGKGLTLEDITKELLRPLLKEWLDANLPATVERLVQEEITRVSRLHR